MTKVLWPPLPKTETVEQADVGGLAARLRAIELQIEDILAGNWNDLATGATGGNTALTTSFQTALTQSYTPPSTWATYKLQGIVWASAAGLTSGDQLQIAGQLTGGVAATGTVVTDDAADAQRSTLAVVEAVGAAGAVDLLTRVRNATASRGTVYVAVSWLEAIRTS